MATKHVVAFVVFNFFLAYFTDAIPERGVKDMTFNKANQYCGFSKSLFKDAKIYIHGVSNTTNSNTTKLEWYLFKSNCAEVFVGIEHKHLQLLTTLRPEDENEFYHFYKQGHEHGLDNVFNLHVITLAMTEAKSKNKKKLAMTEAKSKNKKKSKQRQGSRKKIPRRQVTRKQKRGAEERQLTTKNPKITENLKNTIMVKTKSKNQETSKLPEHPKPKRPTPSQSGDDGNYLLVIKISRDDGKDFNVQVRVKIKSKTGYLSAAEWPLLPYYGAMSLLYLTYGVVWLIVSACQWRELLRIQFWIGGVIALGMLEKAVLFSEYSNANNTGIPANGLVVFAQVLSCIKRTLSRILIIIVSMGFGIVKPRLGAALHRVLGVGFLYFILCVIEGSYREKSVQADVSNKGQLFAAVPLSVLDAVICWWIFMSLMQTMRTLRIRKNIVKLSLYRHFTNILVVAVVASVAFMIWVIKYRHFSACIQDWKELWIDDAFWHFLFALVLLAIMILWRPTANNQRYAFTPLIDVGDDDNDDMTLSDAFQGMKMRNKMDANSSSHGEKNSRNKLEDDLKWVEENIPSAGGIDTALPTLLDSDEEVMTTKLEMNKME